MSNRKYNGRRYWTKEEEELLIKLCEIKPQAAVAKEMGRSVQSIKGKRKSMNIDSFMMQTDLINLTDVARLVGVDPSSIAKTWRKHGLHLMKKGPFRCVSEKVLTDFMKNNTDLWRATKCDYHFFYKYKWFRQKLENEKSGVDCGTVQNTRRDWTMYEVSRFKMLKNRGFTHNQIAAELGRTKRAVDHLSMRINRGVLNVG